MAVAESKSNITLTNITLMRARYGVFFCENFEENWPCYNGTTAYKSFIVKFQMSARHAGDGSSISLELFANRSFTNFSEIWMEMKNFLFKKMLFKISSAIYH